ncbi:DUF397 domain-containing protein [Actinokineospora inagensis]|uniref:DUF397 domain-containing protein n=1 Tax=Actinokineospora inagensis TaxID=103730 RepID=UPI0004211000|nr:DUF397 domain-containing protein [Actinokineospora inagensis]
MRWRKSSFSGDSGNCVEIAYGRRVHVRDSKRPAATLRFTAAAWARLLTGTSPRTAPVTPPTR